MYKDKCRTEIGNDFIKLGIKILEDKGFIIKKIAERNKPYDLLVEFNKLEEYVEVKGLTKKADGYSYNFNINYGKLERLNELNKPVLFLFINPKGSLIVKLEDLIKNKNKLFINGERIILGISRIPDSKYMLNGRRSIMLEQPENLLLNKISNKFGITKREAIKKIINDWNKSNLL